MEGRSNVSTLNVFWILLLVVVLLDVNAAVLTAAGTKAFVVDDDARAIARIDVATFIFVLLSGTLCLFCFIVVVMGLVGWVSSKCVVWLTVNYYDDFVVEITVPSSKGVLSRRNGDDDGETMTRELFPCNWF